jgi:hypothetical protein
MIPPARTNCTSLSRDASIAPSSVARLDRLEAFSKIVLGYINHMLMAEDIDDRFEHYLEHPAVFAPLLTTSSLSLSPDCTRAPLVGYRSLWFPTR